MPHMFDVIVVGTGGVGSAALYHLARRGVKAVGIDRFAAAHDRGSSHGRTRIIRMAYYEHPDYVPLLRRAYKLWDELQGRSGRALFHRTGLLEIGRPHGEVIPGILQSARRYDLAIDRLSDDDIRRQFPQFHCPDGYAGVLERDAGYLTVEDCVRTHLDEAQRLGAEHHAGVVVHGWQVDGSGVAVETDRGTYRAGAAVITAGAWAAGLLTGLGVPLRVLRKPLYWYSGDDGRYAATSGCPTFFYELEDGVFYGFPRIDSLGVKVAEHSGGQLVGDPLAVPRESDPADEARTGEFVRRYLPGVSPRITSHAVCMYTMTPDEHFLVDRHPAHAQVALAAGLSGHGFKFTGVLGELLAELVLDGATSAPAGFLSLARFAPK